MTGERAAAGLDIRRRAGGDGGAREAPTGDLWELDAEFAAWIPRVRELVRRYPGSSCKDLEALLPAFEMLPWDGWDNRDLLTILRAAGAVEREGRWYVAPAAQREGRSP